MTHECSPADSILPPCRGRWQFCLSELLLAFVFSAVACSAAKCLVVDMGTEHSSFDFLHAVGGFLAPGVLCGGIGIVRGRLKFWLTYAIALDALILALLLPSALHQ